MAILGTKLGWRLPCLTIFQVGHLPHAWRSYAASTNATVDVKSENESGTEKPLDAPKQHKRSYKPWTLEEISKARRLSAGGMNRHVLAAMFPGRTARSVASAIHLCPLGTKDSHERRPWSTEETQELVAMCRRRPSKQELREKFPSRSYLSIKAKKADLMLRFAASREQDSFHQMRRRKLWTAEETALLHDFAQQGLSIAQAAAKLDRSFDSVLRRYKRVLRDKMGPWSTSNAWKSQDGELMRLREDGLSITQIADILHRSPHSVKNRWKEIRPRSADGRPLGPVTPRTRVSKPSELSDTDFSHIAHMRRAGASWPTVQESRWCDRIDTEVRKEFHKACVKRITEASSKAPPKERHEHNFSDADLTRIGSMREEGDSWAIIFTIMDPGTTLEGFKSTVNRKFRMAKGK